MADEHSESADDSRTDSILSTQGCPPGEFRLEILDNGAKHAEFRKEMDDLSLDTFRLTHRDEVPGNPDGPMFHSVLIFLHNFLFVFYSLRPKL